MKVYNADEFRRITANSKTANIAPQATNASIPVNTLFVEFRCIVSRRFSLWIKT